MPFQSTISLGIRSIRLWVVVAIFVGVQAAPAQNSVRSPNIIVLLADDLGYADVGFQGCQDIPTPNLDALARAGVRCRSGYASCPVCSPTRAGLLTGRYQQRFGHEYNPALGKDAGMPVTEITVADLLHKAGYVTGAIGKWHLGKEANFHPLKRGFAEFYGFLGGGRSYLPTKGRPKEAMTPIDPLLRNHVELEDPEYLTDAFGEEAVAFIDRHKQEPFFLYLAFNAVHWPLHATEKYLKRFEQIPASAHRTYAAMTSAMDDAVGRVTEKLAAEGLERNTLVFFLSDNGGHPMASTARNTPLRGEKSTVFEGGIRVPFVVKWTGRIPAGTAYDQPVISLDILPTSLAAAGAAPPGRPRLDGVDLLPFLTGQTNKAPHDALFWRYGNSHAVRSGNWKLTAPAGQPRGLYNLSADIGEAEDFSAAEPAKVAELTKLYDRWNAEMHPPRWRDLWMKDAPGPDKK